MYPADPARGLLRHVRCGCGLLFVDPRPADPAAVNEALYGGERRAGERDRSARHDALLREAIARVGRDRRPRVLDVGCGQGAFLLRARALGVEAVGLDLSPARAAEAAERTGATVHAGPLETLPPAAPFDLIRVHHVIEHVPSPRALLTAARDRLAPGGQVALVTPSAASLAHAVLGPAWRQLGRAANGHLALLDPDTLRALAAAAGLSVRSLRTRGARAWSQERRGLPRRAWRLLELLLEPWARRSGRGALLEARLGLAR